MANIFVDRSKSGLLSVMTGAVLLPGAALAQDAPSDDRETKRTRSEIIVTGRSLDREESTRPLPVQVLSGDELAHRRQGGLGETLAGLPGVHLDNFGGGASRPRCN